MRYRYVIAGLFFLLGSPVFGGASSLDDPAAGQNPDNQVSEQEGQNVTDVEESAPEQGSDNARQVLNAKQSPPVPPPTPSAPPRSAAGTKRAELRKITVKETDSGVKVFIGLTAPAQFFSFTRKNPPSVFVQFLNNGILASGGPVDNVAIGAVDQIAYGYDALAPARAGEKAILRYLEFRLNKPAVHYAEQKGPLIVVSIMEAGAGGAVPESAVFETDKYKGAMSIPDNPTLDDFLRVAEGNSKSLLLAEEALNLAKRQVFEARRPLFPAATLRASQTTGDDASPLPNGVSGTFPTTGFQEQEYGVQMAQPIYQSGKIWAGYQRSRISQDAAGESVRKQTGDIDFEAQRAYYDVLKTQAILRLRQELLARASQIRDLTQKKKALKLTSQVDALNVESQYGQIAYQVASGEQEEALSRLNLAAVLNQPHDLPDPVPGELEPRRVKVNLDTILGWAAANRPDLRIAKMNVGLAEKSWKIAKGEDGFRVDATGFLGKSGAAFADETLTLTTAWNVGVKASLPFWGNTLSASRTDEKTAPDLSQSFVTAVHSDSVTLGLLDSLAGRSKAEQARLNYEKAKADYTEALQKAEYEVRDAYYNLAKVSHQLESAQQDVEFRSKQLGVTRERNNLGLAENSQLLTDEMAATQAQISLQEAMAASETGMATLEKATGVKLGR